MFFTLRFPCCILPAQKAPRKTRLPDHVHHSHNEERQQMNSNRKDEPTNKRYYITTAIDYPNAPPHIGHALEKVAADVAARYHPLQGNHTYVCLGTRERRQHRAKDAKEHQ